MSRQPVRTRTRRSILGRRYQPDAFRYPIARHIVNGHFIARLQFRALEAHVHFAAVAGDRYVVRMIAGGLWFGTGIRVFDGRETLSLIGPAIGPSPAAKDAEPRGS